MRAMAIALLTCAFALAADSPFVGTWTMNKAKSTFDPNPNLPKLDSITVQFVQDGSILKAMPTVNGTASPEALLDGKEHTVASTGPNPLGATHYVSTVKGKTNVTVFKKDGKTVGTRKASISPDGKTMTAVTEGTLPDGKKLSSTIVLEKQ